MKTNFTPNQIKWAKSHDWFAYAPEPTISKLTTFQALREWAGY